jgi:hypothetical protein
MDSEEWGIFLGFVVLCLIFIFFGLMIIAPSEIKVMYSELENIEQLRKEYVVAVESGLSERIDEAKEKYFLSVENYNERISYFPTSFYAALGDCKTIVIEQ